MNILWVYSLPRLKMDERIKTIKIHGTGIYLIYLYRAFFKYQNMKTLIIILIVIFVAFCIISYFCFDDNDDDMFWRDSQK